MNKTTLSLLGLLLTPFLEAPAAIVYTSTGSVYSENFDSLPNSPENATIQAVSPWVDDTSSPVGQTSLLGWYLYHPANLPEGGVSGNQRIRIGAGTVNTGAFWSFGSSGSTDRALGGVSSNTLVPTVGGKMYLGLRLTNQTGVTLDQFTLSYNGEQWRDGGVNAPGTPAAQSLIFMWSTTAAAINDPDSLFTAVAELGFTSPFFSATATAIDGNIDGRVAISGVTVSGINWLPGTDLWLRWADTNDPNNDHGLAIDDVSFMAVVPEPASVWVAGTSALVLLGRRRPRRK